jgi:hypothetical protein
MLSSMEKVFLHRRQRDHQPERTQAGDRIALQPTDGSDVPTEQGVASEDGIRYFSAPFADGSTSSIAPGSGADNAQVIPVQATIQYSPTPPPPLQPSLRPILRSQSSQARPWWVRRCRARRAPGRTLRRASRTCGSWTMR